MTVDSLSEDLDLINHAPVNAIYTMGRWVFRPKRVFDRNGLWGFSYKRGGATVLVPLGAVSSIELLEQT